MSQTVIGSSPAAAGSSIINTNSTEQSGENSAPFLRGTMVGTGCTIGEFLMCKSADSDPGILFELVPSGVVVTAQPLGIALATVGPGEEVNCQYAGVVTLTTEQWDDVSDTTGGLARGQRYYHDQSNNGKLTDVAPTSGQVIATAGVGLNSTQLFLTIAPSTTQA